MSTIIKAGFWKNATKVLKGELDLEALIKRIAGNNSGGGGALPVLTEYPTTDDSKVGQKFIYKGNEWKYHSQAELDDLGWTTVSEGFPAPVVKVFNLGVLYEPQIKFSWTIMTTSRLTEETYEFDFLGFGNPANIKGIISTTVGNALLKMGDNIELFRNANLLTDLEDVGTGSAVSLSGLNITGSVLDDLFTQLPPTTKTATIRLTGASGALDCDPTIATAKGYTVVT